MRMLLPCSWVLKVKIKEEDFYIMWHHCWNQEATFLELLRILLPYGTALHPSKTLCFFSFWLVASGVDDFYCILLAGLLFSLIIVLRFFAFFLKKKKKLSFQLTFFSDGLTTFFVSGLCSYWVLSEIWINKSLLELYHHTLFIHISDSTWPLRPNSMV